MAQDDKSGCDIDIYVRRLQDIISKKEHSISKLQEQLDSFRSCLKKEEVLAAKVQGR